jgi:superoxide dismutase, Cu-Zn family
MATRLIATLGVPAALLALVLVLLANAGSPAAPLAEEGGAETRGRDRDRPDAVARLKDADGNFVGVVRFRYEGDEVEVEADVKNITVNPGEFHGFHVHTTGKCDPESVDPATGSPFFSAGGHYNPSGEPHGDHAGDFPVLLVQADGHAEEAFDTDRFRLRELLEGDGSAVIVHADRDNYAHIPDRYHSHTEDVFGPDSATRATGDAGDRFACGVVRRL